jgi:hypothetical protein
MTKKQIKKNWHKENRPIVYNHFNGICQECHKKINVTDLWDIHHLTYNYKNKLYETDAIELIENNIIILICRKCHNYVHTAKDNNNPVHDKYTIENIGKCEICGRNEYRIFDRKRCEKLDKLMCRNCYLEHKKIVKFGIVQTKLF